MGVEGVVGRDYVNAIVIVLSPVLTLCGPRDCSRQVPNARFLTLQVLTK